MISDRILDRAELEAASDWNESKDEPFVIISRSPVIIYAQVEDYSGNLTWMHSAPVMTDDMPVSITAQVMPEKSGSKSAHIQRGGTDRILTLTYLSPTTKKFCRFKDD